MLHLTPPEGDAYVLNEDGIYCSRRGAGDYPRTKEDVRMWRRGNKGRASGVRRLKNAIEDGGFGAGKLTTWWLPPINKSGVSALAPSLSSPKYVEYPATIRVKCRTCGYVTTMDLGFLAPRRLG